MANIDQSIFADAQARAVLLKGMYGARDTDFADYEKIHLLDWTNKPSVDGVKVTVDPSGRNKIMGGKRLLCSSDPIPHVDPKANGDITKDTADDIEKTCKRILKESGRAGRMPLHYSAVESALLYGEVHIPISDTAAMAGAASKGNKSAADNLAKLTPFLLEVWNPHYGYPEYDVYGLSGYLRRVMVRIGELAGRFGQVGADYVEGKNSTTEVELNLFWDRENYAAWVGSDCFVAEAHGLPFIPVSCTLVDGSSLFEKPEQQRQPMLYGMLKSEMWERANLMLTVLYTNIFNIGINPTFIHTNNTSGAGKQLAWDSSTPGGVIDLDAGETFGPMVTKGIIDPSFNQGLEIAERKGEESTMYSQALGQPMGSGAAYATVSLMSQSGKLPLVITQKMCEQAIASALEMALSWYKKNGKALKTFCKPSDIPDNLQIDVKLDVDLPQDKLQMANVGGMLQKAGLTDNDWIRRNILNIEQSGDMDIGVATDRLKDAMVMAYVQAKVPQMVQELLQMTQQPQPGMGQPGQPPPGLQLPPQGMPPAPPQDMTAPPDQGMGQGFNPAQGGLPPGMAGTLPQQGPPDVNQLPPGQPMPPGGI